MTLSENSKLKPRTQRFRKVEVLLRKLNRYSVQSFSYDSSGVHNLCYKFTRRYCIVVGYGLKYFQYKCSQCLKKFKSLSGYNQHCKGHLCLKEQKYMVSPFMFECELFNGKKAYFCLLCKKCSSVFAELKSHECSIYRPDNPSNDDSEDNDNSEDNAEEEEKMIKCDLCGIEFPGYEIHDEHRRDHALGLWYTCWVCKKSVSRLCVFTKHMLDRHPTKCRTSKK